MRIRLPATRSPPCLDARRRGFAMIQGHSEKEKHSRRLGEGPPARAVPRGKRSAQGAPATGGDSDRSGIAGSVSERQLERRARAEGIATTAKPQDRHQPRKLQAETRQPGPLNARPAAKQKTEPLGLGPRQDDRDLAGGFLKKSHQQVRIQNANRSHGFHVSGYATDPNKSDARTVVTRARSVGRSQENAARGTRRGITDPSLGSGREAPAARRAAPPPLETVKVLPRTLTDNGIRVLGTTRSCYARRQSELSYTEPPPWPRDATRRCIPEAR